MGKDKYRRFQENLTFANMVQPDFEEVFGKEYRLKGHWHDEFFRNPNPIILELGCGRGEYTVALAERNPDRNYIGIDIKGARMWRGAKTATERGMANAAFLRTRIEFINSFFASGEVDEIWITFPDPQLKKQRVKKRLTSPQFLGYYAKFLKPDGVVHLKTDSRHLHEYTKAVIERNALPLLACGDDIYGTGMLIRTSPSRRRTSANFVNRACPLPICGSCSAAVRSSRCPISRRTTIWMHHSWANDAASVRAAVVTSVRLPCRGMVVTGYGRKAGGIPPALYHHPGKQQVPRMFFSIFRTFFRFGFFRQSVSDGGFRIGFEADSIVSGR